MPPLIIGIFAYSAATLAAPSSLWRRAIASAYFSTVRIVSTRFSPFFVLDVSVSEKPIVVPPSFCIAASKLRRVRVDGSKKRVARIFPFSVFVPVLAIDSMVLLVFSMWLISSFVKSCIEIMSLFWNCIVDALLLW